MMIKDSSIVLSSSIVSSATGLIVGILMFRYGDIEFYGDYIFASGIVIILSGMLGFRIPEAIGKFQSQFGLSNIALNLMKLNIFTNLISILSMPVTYALYPDKPIAIYLCVAVIYFLKSFDATFLGIVRCFGLYDRILKAEIIAAIMTLLPIAYYFFIDGTVDSNIFLFSLVMSSFIKSIYVCWNVFIVLNNQGCDSLICYRMPRIVWQFLKLDFFNTFLSAPVKNGDIVLVGGLLGPEKVSVYKLAKSLIGMFTQLAGAFSTVLFQKFVEGNKQDNQNSVLYVFKLFSLVMLLALVVFLFIGDIALNVVYGEASGKLYEVVQYMLPGYLAALTLFWVWPLILKEGLLKDALKQTIVINTTYLLIAPITTIYMGELWLAVLTSAVFFISNLWGVEILRKNRFWGKYE